ADMGALLARSIDGAALEGGGTNEPQGILSNGAVDTSISMATPSWVSVFDLVDLVEEADSMVSGFAIRPKLKNTLRKTPRVASGDASFVMDSDGSLAGYPALASTQMPAGSIIAGYWPDLLIGYWSTLDLLINPYASEPYSKGNVAIRGMLTADVALRHPESFAAAIDGPGSP
ncbi:MAG: phage major capsid protein, partial [Pseudomonadota bacterium]